MSKTKVIVAGGLRCAQSLWLMRRGFEHAGCATTYVRTTERKETGKGYRAEATDQIRAAARAGARVLYWWQPNSDQHAPELVRELRADFPGLRTVMQSLDDPFALDIPDAEARFQEFEFAVTCCAGSVAWYAARGVGAMVGYPPCDAEFNGRAKPGPRWDISYVGTNVYPRERYRHVLADRIEQVEAVRDLGELALYGHWDTPRGWARCGDAVKPAYMGWADYPELPGIYAGSRINLCSHVRPDGVGYLNERVVQAMSSGGFLLCDAVAGIDEIFEGGVELALWRDVDVLREKAAWHLKHEDKRRAIAAKGREKALRLFDNGRLAAAILRHVGAVS